MRTSWLAGWCSQEEVIGADSGRLGKWQGGAYAGEQGSQRCRGRRVSGPVCPGTSRGAREASCFSTKAKLRCQDSLPGLLQGSQTHTYFCGGIFFLSFFSLNFLKNKNNCEGFKMPFFNDISALRFQQRMLAKNVPCHHGCLPLFEVSG